MARKLKTYQTSLGFFDLAVAAPSMKAALEAWGVSPFPNALLRPALFPRQARAQPEGRQRSLLLPACSIQGVLRVVDGLLPSLTLLPLGSLFLCAFALAALLLSLESECGLPVGCLVFGSLRMFLRLSTCRFAASPFRSAVAGKIDRQLRVLLERSAGADGTL
ncbi:hypothetical protein OZ411_15225 [Bradyrhizobium sp. Arg237L]|uniref:hypothetical protein n=1 Tax=Bradyrhizobium sp. Arg237L TaxID=3003352 RepID=UPI00249E1E64|nr:hypothetical protein [Bradyrhizobium sp. Arg237L]MDI4234164.1 hypothetical protein [Bradyrhizobium sp. Arg237L]